MRFIVVKVVVLLDEKSCDSSPHIWKPQTSQGGLKVVQIWSLNNPHCDNYNFRVETC